MTAGHTLLEIFSFAYNKFFLYDPLYGVFYLDETGNPASVIDMQQEIGEKGFRVETWRFRPIRMFEGFSTRARPARDPRYQGYNDVDYKASILRYYFHVVALRHEDVTAWPGASLTLEDEIARGRWLVFNNIPLTNLGVEWENKFFKQFYRDYDRKGFGRFHLSVVRSVPSPFNARPEP